ncbi:MAG: DUF3276 family protein [Bacteroidales bacterium]|nr:DUF3276 family protein [Bacteroidales bacterium]MBQ2482332.1 DUF3276 family protein [Bacteroidales bacterium]MBQ2491798.1 DUF3276 family protein [Bacteroidales bacterium]MBQ4197258.1 DUF3276 family protein [Bacteroidales bacterium]
MYQEDFDNAFSQEKSGDDIYSRPVRAGKRTYFFDVKATKNNDYYLTITESKRKVEKDGRFSYDKHKIFLYKEDFEKFAQGLEEVVQFIKEKCPVQERVYSEPSETPQFHNSSDEGTNDFTNVDFDKL